jgi:AAA+ superfamily predicted ATPase
MVKEDNMSFNEQVLELMAIKKPCIQIRTNLEKEMFPTLLNLLFANDIDNVYRIDELDKVEQITVNAQGEMIRQPVEHDEYGVVQFNPMILLPWVRGIANDKTTTETSAFIFVDYDNTMDRPTFRRWIKDVFEFRNEKYTPFIFISSEPQIPEDMKHLFSVVYYDTPVEDEIKVLIRDYARIKEVSINDIDDLAHKFIGFNRTEIIECLNYSFYKYGEVNDNYIKEKRIEVIKKSSVLDYREPRMTIDQIGGNKYFKDWYQETKFAFEPEAKQYGVPMPKGYLSLGAPGVAKSMFAEAIAADLNVPLVFLDMSRLLSKFVGESERNIDQAIQIIKQVAPCVLLIDEVEKALGGYKSSNASDSGTLARVFGKVLNLLADNDNGIYTVMTSNNVKDLPPELTRAGRLDAIWYMGLPTEEERAEIFELHLKKRGHKVSKTTLKKIAKETNKYTGAEIEQIVISAIRKAYVRMRKANSNKYKIETEDLISAKENVIPVAVSSKETINELEDWAKGRALYSNKANSKKNKDLLDKVDEIDFDDII